MAVNLSIKGVPDDLATRLRQRAEANHRSLQGELMSIVERAVTLPSDVDRAPIGVTQHNSKNVDEWLAERRLRPSRHIDGLPLAVDIIRADRDKR